MANETLGQKVKNILAVGKAGDYEGAYALYRDLFSDPSFTFEKAEHQRQALKLMVLAKGAPNPPTAVMIEAHRAALGPLTELVSQYEEPADFEMLGACHVLLGNIEAASNIFKAALAIERQRDPGSPLCGHLMKRVSEI